MLNSRGRIDRTTATAKHALRKAEKIVVEWVVIGSTARCIEHHRPAELKAILQNTKQTEQMKRDGYIIEEIVEQANLEEAFDSVVHGTLRKTLREGAWLLNNRETFLQEVREEIMSGNIKLGHYHEKTIKESVKVRKIQVFSMKDRIKINAVMTVVDKHLKRRYIRTTSASIQKRGMHDLLKYIQRDMKEDSTIRYWYKFDINKCYDTVQHDFVKYSLKRVFKDKRLLNILFGFIDIMPNGVRMSMGMRSSQGLVNLLLSTFLDHYLKDRYGIKHFYRYMDDGVVGASNKQFLWVVRDIVHEQIEFIGQTIKHNERVFPIEEGLDFLGYVIYPDKVLLRKRIKKKYCRKLAKVKSRKRRQELIASLYGMAKHCDSKKLLSKLLTRKEMIKFSDLGISYVPKDGKKRFKGERVRLASIVNVPIEIHDFERNITTKQGDGRYLVAFKDTRNGNFGKFFTNSDEMKAMLDAIADKGNVFPILTTIQSAPFEGGHGTSYYFT